MKAFLAFAIAVLIVGSALAQNRRARLYEIASSKTIRNVNKSDVRAALKVWVELIAQQKGFSLDSKVDIVDTVGEITERLQKQYSRRNGSHRD